MKSTSSVSARKQDYRSLLMDEYKTRRQMRSQFSLNTFARHIGLTPSHFNDLIKKRRGLSEDKARQICERLGLSEFEQEFFMNSVRSLHSRTKSEREQALQTLKKLEARQVTVLKNDLFALVSQWQHFAILELTRLQGFQFDEKWIAERLNLDVKIIRTSMERLVELGMVHKNKDRWVSHKGILNTAADIPSLAAKSHHSQALNLARKAIYEQEVGSREFSTIMLAFDKSKLAKAKKRIREFQLEMSELLTAESDQRDSLYCLGIQFFSLVGNIKPSQ